MRLVRFDGAGKILWPIGMHMLLVGDLVAPPGTTNPWLEVYGLLHDAAEVCIGDIPRPMKTPEQRDVEEAVLARTYAFLGVPQPSKKIIDAVKRADFQAVLAEGAFGCAARGFKETQTNFSYKGRACLRLNQYLAGYKFSDAYKANGLWPLTYEIRLRKALRKAQNYSYYNLEAKAA
jgi:hypothetical protein